MNSAIDEGMDQVAENIKASVKFDDLIELV